MAAFRDLRRDDQASAIKPQAKRLRYPADVHA